MQKKCKVVMLPTNQEATNGICIVCHKNGQMFMPQTGAEARRAIANGLSVNHLYIISDDDIKVGDVIVDIYNPDNLGFTTVYHNGMAGHSKLINYRKLVATTNPELSLPSPSKSFIQKYCEIGGVNEIIHEYEECFMYTMNNTVHPVKNSWTRDEVQELCNAAFICGQDNLRTYEDWEKENL